VPLQKNKESPLLQLIRKREQNCWSLDDIKQHINSADINRADEHGLTPLHCAVLQPHHYPNTEELVKCLIENGANLENVCNTGDTPLALAIQAVQPLHVIKLLIPRIIDRLNRDGYTALHLAVDIEPSPEQLHAHIYGGVASACATGSCRRDITELVECLMQNGANPNTPSTYCRVSTNCKVTPLLLAMQCWKPLPVIKLLITSTTSNYVDDGGRTPLCWVMHKYDSTSNQCWDLVQCLIKSGANLNIADQDLLTPLLHFVIKKRDLSVIHALIINTLSQNPDARKPADFSADSDISDMWNITSWEIKSIINQKISPGTCSFYTLLKGDPNKLAQIVCQGDINNLTKYLLTCSCPILSTMLKDRLAILKPLIEARYQQLERMRKWSVYFNEHELSMERSDCADSRNNTTKNWKEVQPACMEKIYENLRTHELKIFYRTFFPATELAPQNIFPCSNKLKR
jgi:ankyrin repeat protein